LPLVEMRRIELLSENPLIQPSSWTVCYLDFPLESANRHAFSLGSPFLHDRFKSERPMHVHHCDDVQAGVVVVHRRNGRPAGRGTAKFYTKKAQNLGSHSNFIVVVYFLRLGSLRDYPARHAYRTSESPSKPLHPHLEEQYYYNLFWIVCQPLFFVIF